ncbi:MAG: hypothetical protein ACTSXQ_02805 [Alphaproteobacteria bacterium]
MKKLFLLIFICIAGGFVYFSGQWDMRGNNAPSYLGSFEGIEPAYVGVDGQKPNTEYRLSVSKKRIYLDYTLLYDTPQGINYTGNYTITNEDDESIYVLADLKLETPETDNTTEFPWRFIYKKDADLWVVPERNGGLGAELSRAFE